jgi:uncharacterized short protein YbdD (DUF466 family)
MARDEAIEVVDSAAAGGDGVRGRLRALRRELRTGYHQVFGIPDYDAYLRHMEREHPGSPPLSRREFFAAALERKYSRRGPRCC